MPDRVRVRVLEEDAQQGRKGEVWVGSSDLFGEGVFSQLLVLWFMISSLCQVPVVSWSPPQPCTSLPNVQPRGHILPIYIYPKDKKEPHPFSFYQQGALLANGGQKEQRSHKTSLLNFFGVGQMGGDAMEAQMLWLDKGAVYVTPLFFFFFFM